MPYGKKKIDLLYEDLTYEIRGILFEVQNGLVDLPEKSNLRIYLKLR